MKKRITVTIDEDVLDKEFELRTKGVSRSQHIEDMLVAQMDSKVKMEVKKGKKE